MLPCMAPELVTTGPTSWLRATRPWRRWWPRITPYWPDNKVTEKVERLKVEHVTYLECREMDPKSQPVRKFISGVTANRFKLSDSSQLRTTPRATPMYNPLFPRPPLTTATYVSASFMGSSHGRNLMRGYAAIYSQSTPLYSSLSILQTPALPKTVPRGKSSSEGQITISTSATVGGTGGGCCVI